MYESAVKWPEVFERFPYNSTKYQSPNHYYTEVGRMYGRNRCTVRDQYKRHVGELVDTSPNPPGSASPDATAGKHQWQEKGNQADWSFNGSAEGIQTLEQALAFSGVDLETWEVERHVFNKWDTTMKGEDGQPVKAANIQVKVWFRRKVDADIDWGAVLERVEDHTRNKSATVAKAEGSGVGIAAASDFHFGAYVDDLLRSDAFNISVLVEYLEQMADQINAKGLQEVHVFLLGDFIESFTGLNHRNSWKGLGKGMFGAQATILCFEILTASLLEKVNNLASISLVSGNHDRVTSDKELDPKGEVTELLAYMLRNHFEQRVPIHFHPLVLTREVDGICYILTHGHHGFSKKDLSQVVRHYGKQGMFNVVLQGHTHSRQIVKQYKRNQFRVDEVEVVGLDESDARRIVVPPMFTGNFYSEALGFSSSAGWNFLANNGKGKPNFADFTL